MTSLRLITSKTLEVPTLKVQIAAKLANTPLTCENSGSAKVLELFNPSTATAPTARYTGPVLRYISRLHADNSVPDQKSLGQAASIDSWLDFAELELSPVESGLAMLEEHLKTHTFLSGDYLSIADASVVTSLVAGLTSEADLKDYPNVLRYIRTCLANPAVADVLSRYASKFPVPEVTPFVPGKGEVESTDSEAPKEEAKKPEQKQQQSKKRAADRQNAKVSHKELSMPAPEDVPTNTVSPVPEGSEPPVHPYSSCVGGRTRVKDILLRSDGGAGLIGKSVSVCGWVRTKRSQGSGFAFVEISDGSCLQGLQLVLDSSCPDFEGAIGQIATGASVQAIGTLVASPAKGQAVEVSVRESGKIKVIGGVESAAYPLAKKQHSREFLREIAHLRPRTNLIGAVARVRSSLSGAVHSFFMSRDFKYVHTPLITSADCEGAGEMFQVTSLLQKGEGAHQDVKLDPETGRFDYKQDFFGRPTYLTVSGQLNVENYACALSDVYTFGPCFRAENSHTSRHLAEFWMIEPELCFADIHDNMKCAEEFIQHCARHVLAHCREDIAFFDKFIEKGLIKRLENLIAEPFARVSYTEAIEKLLKAQKSGKAKFENTNIYWGFDLDSEHERYLTEKIYKKPVIVYNYPAAIKAFYMRANADEDPDKQTVAAMDILAPLVGEVCGGSVREERLDVLDKKLADLNMDIEDYWWYRDLRRFGSVPHAGFGIGFERLIMMMTGVENIRDVIPYPRYPGRCEF
ncbi:Asparaginyl-tRNA synthetase [Perkinsus olseni]|uniref:asparagine--tRNA ligase n=1 Tax=Perkinsus olseni TaxID=32597 RepID=A0A7J6M8D8_PEROL|nr:Asparaginyl-tRNA synthetase [Perkinsus olseni]